MADFARSDDPRVQRQLDRLAALSPGGDILGLDRITRLLARLGDPQRSLPPVFHVAGTNGKGSTCAFLRAALEAAGHRVHVYTSPHLVRFNERMRLAGALIEDTKLAPLLREVLDAAGDIGPSFFEATTAAAFLAFARASADAAIIEVGLGGRLDATNVVDAPLVTGIAALGLDHQQFLGDQLAGIAAEKAGIAKAGVPLVTLRYPETLAAIVEETAEAAGAQWLPQGGAWDASMRRGQIEYRDAAGSLTLPVPRLAGAHQAANAALAIAMLRHQRPLSVPAAAMEAAMRDAAWPARLQRLAPGALSGRLPPMAELWLDGGHNPSAARAVATHFRDESRTLHIVLGLLANKDADGVIGALADLRPTLHAVPVPDHPHHAPEALAQIARTKGLAAHVHGGVEDALDAISAMGAVAPVVLIMGSLYLAGEALARNEQIPD